MPADFHPAVTNWFDRTFDAPTPAQSAAWPAIIAQRHVLIAAPTGSGKTLAAFLAVIDELVREGAASGLPDETRVVYVSPLKALSNDIQRNLNPRSPAYVMSSPRSDCRRSTSAPSSAPATLRSTSAPRCANARHTSW